jgi:DNA modification methylase
VGLGLLFPDPANARKHSERNIEEIARSLREFGQHAPLVVQRSTNRILVGNGRWEAMKRLGWPEAQVLFVDDDNITAVRRALADNRTAELAEWDDDVLSALLEGLGENVEIPGWSEDELMSIMESAKHERDDEDRLPEAQKTVVSEPGDVWLLGPHRLICGDCTSPETIEHLFNGARPHLMVTDPPYGVEYNPKWRNRAGLGNTARTGVVLNDNRDDWREAWYLFPGDVAYVWHASTHSEMVARSLKRSGFVVRSQIVWAKPRFALSRGDYHWQHECCLYATREDGGDCPDMPGYCEGYASCWYVVRDSKKSHWQGSRKMSTLWEIDFSGQDATTTHGTQKPVECMRRPMINNSAQGEIVYEPFSGSGTTIIAAESVNRICYAAELNPEYVDMAVRRWQEYTGEDALHEGSGKFFDERARVDSSCGTN